MTRDGIVVERTAIQKSEIRRVLEERAADILGLPEADRVRFATTGFVHLGGDSLRAMSFAAWTRDRFGVKVPLDLLLSGTPMSVVLDEVSAEVDGVSTSVVPETATVPLSAAQQGMWIAEKVLGGSPYNLVFIAFADGALNPELLANAVREVVDRHDGLRTVFTEHSGTVAPRAAVDSLPELFTLPYCGTSDFAGAVRAAAEEHGRHPFNLAAAPALRFLHMTDGAQHALILVAHHMVLDGWAVGLVLKEIFATYEALEAGRRPSEEFVPSIRDLARYQELVRERGDWDTQRKFWSDHLRGVSTRLDLPSDRTRPTVQDPAGKRISLQIDAATTTLISDHARQLGVTQFVFLLSAFALTLSRYTGAHRLLIGVPVSLRDTTDLERLVAVANNLVPVLVEVDDDATAADYLHAVHNSLVLAIENRALPFEEIVTLLGGERDPGGHPLVQVSFEMHDRLLPRRLRTSGLDVRIEHAHGGGSQFDLSLLVGQSTPNIAADLEFATGVWTDAEADAFIADFAAAAEQLATGVDGALGDLRCIAPARRAMLDRLNDTARHYPATSLQAVFRDIVLATPDATAVREGDQELTYAELAGVAAHQASLLREAGVGPGSTVVVGIKRSTAEIVAVLGVVLAGAAYVGIDFDQPAEWTRKLVDRLAPAAVLAEDKGARQMAELGVRAVPSWNPSWSQTATELPTAATDPDRLAYVAFTSGSSGIPKGVCATHRGVIRLVHNVTYVWLGPGERLLRFAPLSFDASTLEIWGALLTGATMEILPAGLPSPAEFGRFLTEQAISVAFLTSGLFRLMAEYAPETFATVRHLLTGGDAASPEHFARVMEHNPSLVISNVYGPTENTTFTTAHELRNYSQIEDPLPIGIPISNTHVYILDDRHRILPPGAIGELYTGGDGLAHGYFRDEQQTARSFGMFSPDVPERLYRTGDLVRLDTKGRIAFLGRTDDQVKLRGYRIQPREVVKALCEHPDVHDAVVAVTIRGDDGKQLFAACVPEASATLDTSELREFVARRVPTYMVPAQWVVVERIPLISTGKADVGRLGALARPAGGAPTATTGRNAEIMRLVSEVMGRDIGAGEDFFVAGGNSLRAFRLITLVQERLGVSLRLRDFLMQPTPEGLVRLVSNQETGR